jgi:hypothetical protein
MLIVNRGPVPEEKSFSGIGGEWRVLKVWRGG